VNKDGREKAVNLVGVFGMKKVDHSAYVLHAVNLGAQVCRRVKIAFEEGAMLQGGDHALALYAYAAGSADQLAVHVLVVSLGGVG